ncbi:NAD(P)-binding protein [Rhodococcus sp. D2-41]|uniref:FAD-dependent oxidoreductase n=1 Tax=Speluncibacter jeojiensis TaxID=2710754 RepID=A0A9X4M080_9ACTN|nr:FAD-dependent oxidoreductase [Rhodococcus sp. D2-41]MDG3009052.1 NAD(P)-binding protein [Rhodococcus sp. D2-41]MDG3015564.1 FAD-dependent oxidoreductase [Corynebacteriales bacterium D3-21]
MTDTAPARVSRRSFLGGAATLGAVGLGAVAATTTTAPRARASTPGPRGRRVAVFGGGMSGLVTAQELVERGFEVDVFESRPVMGGKARSFGVPGTATAGRGELPAEHGFRFFPGFYRNVPDSMRRIPFPGNPDGVLGNMRDIASLLDGDGFGGAASLGPGRSLAGFLPLDRKAMRPVDPGRLTDPAYLSEVVREGSTLLASIPNRFPLEMADFGRCVTAYVTSCEARRKTDWDRLSWWDFLDAAHKSTFFQDAVAKMTTMGLVAVKPEVCSVSSAGNIIEAFLWNLLLPLPGPDDAWIARFLNGPTSDVWVTPWVRELERLGVRFHTGASLQAFDTAGGRISGARVADAAGSVRQVEADHYVSAVPVDRAVRILRTPELLRLDPSLDGIAGLHTDWMNGLMIYLRRPLEVARGLIGVVDHPWTLSAIAQSQTWSRPIAPRFGDGTVGEIVSIDISNWDGIGTTTVHKSARHCTAQEIYTEVWDTLRSRFGPFDRAFADDNVHSWFLDPAISWDRSGRVHNDEPLTVQTVGTWAKRPKGPTAIPNLFVAGDWIQTNANVVSMEGANQGGRIAAQAVLDAAGSAAEPVLRYDYYVPAELDGLKRRDAARHAAGLPNIFDV